MSLYPSAPDIFVNRTGADAIASSDPNNAYDAIEAIEGFLGSSGAAQSNNAALVDYLLDAYSGGRCYLKDADEIYIGPFRGIIANAAGTIKKFRTIATVTTLTAASIDTGSFAAATYYYIYATADAASTAPTFIISASGSAPTGYSFYRRIGWFYNETISVIDILNNKISTFIGGDNDRQILMFEAGAVGSGAITTPFDNSVPTISEGNEFMTYPFIPTNATTRLKISVVAHAAASADMNSIVAALFGTSGTDALGVGFIDGGALNEMNEFKFTHIVPIIATTAPMTFRVKIGADGAGTITFNGKAGAGYYGGAGASSLIIEELKP